MTKKYRAKYRLNGKDIHVGYFTTKAEADAARDRHRRLQKVIAEAKAKNAVQHREITTIQENHFYKTSWFSRVKRWFRRG